MDLGAGGGIICRCDHGAKYHHPSAPFNLPPLRLPGIRTDDSRRFEGEVGLIVTEKALKLKPGAKRIGSIYSGAATHQDLNYQARVEANVKARAAKRKQEREAAA